ncbi:MAG: hypothetical protein A2015_15450 [Spirochaetes bacterium GWF1_31_7]|nr:MAG: hypothetical protein A2015_15450 [Spirochaetes bacterium GWF1_31_7]
MKYCTRVLFILLLITTNINAAELNFSNKTITLEECIKIAETASLDTAINDIQKSNYDLAVISRWFNYLPDVDFNMYKNYSYLDVGKENNYQLPRNYADFEETTGKSTITGTNLPFRQKIFDANLVTLLSDANSIRTKRDIITDEFKVNLHEKIRRNYYEILLNEQKLNYYTAILDNFKPATSTGYDALLHADDRITALRIEKIILDLNEAVINQKRYLLYCLQLPLNKQLILTTPLVFPELNTDADKASVLLNNTKLKNLRIKLYENKRTFAMGFMQFIPKSSLSLDTIINDNLKLGVDVNLDGSNFGVDLIGEYLIYQNKETYYIYKDAKEPVITSTNNPKSINDWNINDTKLKLQSTISLDRIASAGVDIKRLRNAVEMAQIDITREKNILLINFENIALDISGLKKDIELVTEKLAYAQSKKELLKKSSLQDDIAKLEYYESRNNDILSYTESLFNTKLDLIKAYIIYMRVIQGGGYL